ncbi:MAG: hypothetical protein P4L74_07420 [Candidatus Doudnabacteria bacterium]|nr:hypothetical protein [Candidatus Doudnabacteria bacterium]
MKTFVCFLMFAGLSQAGTIFNQGFESNTSGWTPSNGGSPVGTITRVASGTGGITAASGGFYAQITNSPNDYMSGYGDYGFSYFGAGGDPTVYPGSAFSESISVYIDPSSAGTNYWIDFTPGTSIPDGVGCGNSACGDEHNFRLAYDGSSVSVAVDGGGTMSVLNNPGWYTFQATFAKGSHPGDLVQTNMNILSGTNLIGTAAVLGNSDGETLTSANLSGTGFVWFAVAQNGAPTLNIDNLNASTLGSTPEPATWGLGGTALLLLGIAKKKALKAGI